MNHEVAVRVPDCGADPPEQFKERAQRRLALSDVLVDRNALNVLHDQERGSVRRGSAVEQARDVGMFQVRQDLALGAETMQDVLIARGPLHDLDRNFLREGIV